MTIFSPDKIDWKKMDGLVPVVVQDTQTRQVLMVAFMNPSALAKTMETKKVTFYSRSKKRLWTKGETSGNELNLVEIYSDCDNDTLLILAKPTGPACHTHATTCFPEDDAPGVGMYARLEQIIEDRFNKRPADSYTTKLFEKGIDRIAQKVGEEAVEVVIASKNESKERLAEESADLLFHLGVLWRQCGISLKDVTQVLRRRNEK